MHVETLLTRVEILLLGLMEPNQRQMSMIAASMWQGICKDAFDVGNHLNTDF